jgi:hypothetical protein
MASSLVNRGSFDVKPAYISGDYIGTFFYAPLDYHVNAQYFSADSPMWYSYHSFGLPLLLAPFLLLALQLHIPALHALQLGMLFWQALGVVVVYLYTLELVRRNAAAIFAAITLLGSLSFLALVGKLYPDILTGTLVVASLLCLTRLRQAPEKLWPVAMLSALAGFAPYLHVKTLLISLTLLSLGGLHWWRNGRSKKTLACLLIPAGVLLAIYAIKIHAWYHTWVITAPFSNGLLFNFPPGPAIVANVFDTSRGVLPNNPAYLLILAGLPIWWKRDRNSALVTLAVLVPSLLFQSTFADWAGGCSPAGGRYLMTYVLCALPAAAFLFTKLRWFGRCLLAIPLFAGAAIGIYNTRADLECSYAGDINPMIYFYSQEHHIEPDFAIPIFSHDLTLNGGSTTVQLMFGVGVALAVLAAGIVVARQRREHQPGLERWTELPR